MNRSLLAVAIVFCEVSSAHAEPADKISAAFDCAERHVPKWIWVDQNQINLTLADIQILDPPYMGAYGLLGWHTTWYVLFNLNGDHLIAYETFVPQDGLILGPMKVPAKLRAALSDCALIGAVSGPASGPKHFPLPTPS